MQYHRPNGSSLQPAHGSGAVPPTQSVTLRLRPYREEEIGDRSCFELSIEER